MRVLILTKCKPDARKTLACVAVALLRSLYRNGPAQVDFLINRQNGQMRFLEIEAGAELC